MNKQLLAELEMLYKAKQDYEKKIAGLASVDNWENYAKNMPVKPRMPDYPFKPSEPRKPPEPVFEEEKEILPKEQFINSRENKVSRPSTPTLDLSDLGFLFKQFWFYIVEFFIICLIIGASQAVVSKHPFTVFLGVIGLIAGIPGLFVFPAIAVVKSIQKYIFDKKEYEKKSKTFPEECDKAYEEYVKVTNEKNNDIRNKNLEKKQLYQIDLKTYELSLNKYKEDYIVYENKRKEYKEKEPLVQKAIAEYERNYELIKKQTINEIQLQNEVNKKKAKVELETIQRQLSFEMPSRWDNRDAIREFIGYVKDGRADDLKEAINLLVEERRIEKEREREEMEKQYEKEREREEERDRCRQCARYRDCSADPHNCPAFIPMKW